MKFNEWNLDQTSIFAELDDLNPNSVIGEIGTAFLTNYYVMNYGEKIVPKSIVKMSSAEIATIINGMYFEQWERLKELYINVLPVGVESEITIDETNIDVGSKEVSNSNINKVTAFNDDSFSNDDSTDATVNEIDNRDRNKKYTQTKKTIESIEKHKRLIYNDNIVRTICLDVSKVVSLSIY